MSTRDLIACWLFKEQWNFTERPTFEEFEAYSKACLAGASADGQLAEAERDWVVGYFATIGLPDEYIPGFQAAQPQALNQELIDRLRAFRSTPAGHESCRGLVYDCARAAGADEEYHPDESRAVHEIARGLEIDDSVTSQIEDFYRQEQALKTAKLKVLFPEGIRFLAPQP